VEIVREIHAGVIERFGGSDGVREMALLESAVAAPQASFGGKSPYADPAEVAAAYLYYLCKNHPFVDGNKRAALGACIVFLRMNGIEPKADGPEWEELTLAVAASTIDRDETTGRLRRLLRKSD
jgi:death-on-curing protein